MRNGELWVREGQGNLVSRLMTIVFGGLFWETTKEVRAHGSPYYPSTSSARFPLGLRLSRDD